MRNRQHGYLSDTEMPQHLGGSTQLDAERWPDNTRLRASCFRIGHHVVAAKKGKRGYKPAFIPLSVAQLLFPAIRSGENSSFKFKAALR